MSYDNLNITIKREIVPYLARISLLCCDVGNNINILSVWLGITLPKITANFVNIGMNALNYIASDGKTSIDQLLNALKKCGCARTSVSALTECSNEILSIQNTGGWSAYNLSLRQEKLEDIESLTAQERSFANRIIDREIVSMISGIDRLCSKLSENRPYLVAFSVVYDIDVEQRIIVFANGQDDGLTILNNIADQKKMTIRDLLSLFGNIPETGKIKRDLITMIKNNARNTNESTVSVPPHQTLHASIRSTPISDCISTLKAWKFSPTLPTGRELYRIDELATILGNSYPLLVSLKDPLFTKIHSSKPEIAQIPGVNQRGAAIILTMIDSEINRIISALSLISKEEEDASKSKVCKPPTKIERVQEPATSNKENKCCICTDKKRDVLFLPCRHMSCCKDCSEKFTKCPLCKTIINQRIDILIP
jgi:hypothetical protein